MSTKDQDAEKYEKVWRTAYTSSRVRYIQHGSKKETMEDSKGVPRTYKKILADEKGRPRRYTADEFKEYAMVTIEKLKKVIDIDNHLKKMTKEGTLKEGQQFVQGSMKIALNQTTIKGMFKFVEERIEEMNKIFYTNSKSNPRLTPPRIEMYGSEFVDFIRAAAVEGQLGGLLPKSEKKQKSQFPFLFGHAEGYENIAVVKSGFVQSLLPYYFAATEAGNAYETGESYNKQGKSYYKNPTYSIPQVMRDTMPESLEALESKYDGSEKDKQGYKKVYNPDFFSSAFIISLKGVLTKSVDRDTKDAVATLKLGSGYEDLRSTVIDETKEVIAIMKKASQDRTEEKKKADKESGVKPKKSTKRKSDRIKEANEREDNRGKDEE